MSQTSSASRGLFWVIVTLLAAAPIPLGSNRPFFWAVNASIVACAAIVYLLAIRLDLERLRVPPRAVGWGGILFVAAILWMLIQIAPLPDDWSVTWAWKEAAQALGRHLQGSISVDRSATIWMIIRLLTYAILFFLALQATANPARARRMVKAVFWITVAHAAVAILMLLELGDKVLLIFPKWAYQGFATGFFVNRNSFATFVAMGFGLGTLLALDVYLPAGTTDSRRRSGSVERLTSFLVYAAGLAVLLTASLLSASRMGVVVAALGAALAFEICWFRSQTGRGGIALGFVGILFLAVAALLVSGGNLTDRVGSLESNADDRLLLYQQVAGMVAAHPWTGYGGGTFSAVFPLFHRLPLSADVTWDAAHDLYLELFADLGFAAVGALIAAVILFGRLVRAIFLSGIDWLVPAAGVVVLVIGAVHSIVDFSLQIEANVLVVLVVVASGIAQAWIAAMRLARSGAPAGAVSERSISLDAAEAQPSRR
jgi:O-antigen ligase